MRLLYVLRRFRRDERGQSLVFVTLVGVVLLGFTAMVTDAGLAYWNRRLLQNAADGAALAGAAYLPNDPATATAVAEDYVAKNGIGAVSGDEVEVTVENGYGPYDFGETPVALTVTIHRPFNIGLRYIIGAGDATVAARATAVVAPAEPASLWPFGMLSVDAKQCKVACDLKHKDPERGNFGFVDLDGEKGGGSPDIGSWIRNNFNGEVPPPVPGKNPPEWSWLIWPETGNMDSNHVTSALDALFEWDKNKRCDGGQNSCAALYGAPPSGDYNPQTTDGTVCYNHTECPRVGIVPVLANQNWPSGQSEQVKVVGFTCVYMLAYNPQGGGFTVTMRDVGQCFTHIGGSPVFGAAPDATGRAAVYLWQ